MGFNEAKQPQIKAKIIKFIFFFLLKKNTIARLNKLNNIDSASIILENDV